MLFVLWNERFCIISIAVSLRDLPQIILSLMRNNIIIPSNLQTTPSVFMANYSPLSLENHRSLFVEPAKRGKQRAGGEALSALHHYTFNYQ